MGYPTDQDFEEARRQGGLCSFLDQPKRRRKRRRIWPGYRVAALMRNCSIAIDKCLGKPVLLMMGRKDYEIALDYWLLVDERGRPIIRGVPCDWDARRRKIVALSDGGTR